MKMHQPIIPLKAIFHSKGKNRSYDYKSIAVFAAMGFFPGKNTYYNEVEVLQPATDYDLNEKGEIISEKKWWEWHYHPRDISLKQVVEEFAHLLGKLVNEPATGKKIILPLSGGLDSRTLAAELSGNKNVHALSYEFEHGYRETEIGRRLAAIAGFDFTALKVPRGYLWDVVESLSEINGCYAEFTNARQMAFIEEFRSTGDHFMLGHWGDVLFDNVNASDDMDFDAQVSLLLKKVIKKGGIELSEMLWQAWGIEGNFKDHLRKVISELLAAIKIDNPNARLRAFKSMYWAPRWTSTNLAVFSSVKPVSLPYYHDEMCRFICTVPEYLLSGRKIQIEYLRMKSPEMSTVTWQAHKPFNLYNYHHNHIPYNLPYRIQNKIANTMANLIGNPFVQRNWELQFKGAENNSNLKKWLFENESLNSFVPIEITREFYDRFRSGDSVYWSHPVSMLLTLSLHRRKNS